MKSLRRPFRIALCVLPPLLLAACESKPDRHARMEEARHAVPPMAANERFFDGAVIAHLTLGSDPGASGAGGETEGGGRHSGGGGGRHHGGGGMGGGGMGGGGMHQGGGQAGGQAGGGEGAPSPTLRASQMPPVRLRLRLENTTAAPIEVEVRDLDSELGDFAVRPDKLSLPPGQSVETDPMESTLGVDSYALPVTITLRTAGRTESKVLTLQVLPSAPDASASPAGS